jgi:hypothetical protein
VVVVAKSFCLPVLSDLEGGFHGDRYWKIQYFLEKSKEANAELLIAIFPFSSFIFGISNNKWVLTELSLNPGQRHNLFVLHDEAFDKEGL